MRGWGGVGVLLRKRFSCFWSMSERCFCSQSDRLPSDALFSSRSCSSFLRVSVSFLFSSAALSAPFFSILLVSSVKCLCCASRRSF